MSRSSPYLLCLRAGPIWDTEQKLRHLAEAFGRWFDGEMISRSPQSERITVGRFRIRTHPLGPDWIPSALRKVAYAARVVARGLRLRWLERRELVVITYDPFESGVIGLVLRWFAGATFICEVNGVYGHADTFIDFDDQEEAEAKRRRMVRFGTFVLRRAHLIKLLYPEQLVGFPLDADHPPRVWFHDMINVELYERSGAEPERRLIFVGHPYLLKGVDLLLEAFSRVAPDFPEWRLFVVGWLIENSAKKAGATYPRERVKFFGPQDPPALRLLMEESSGLVLPSRSEGMGRVLLEAAFLGRARIGSRAGGIPWVIEDGVDGLLFDAGDVDDLERALRTYLGASQEERREMGHSARDRALERFTNVEYMRRYREVIAGLTGEISDTVSDRSAPEVPVEKREC